MASCRTSNLDTWCQQLSPTIIGQYSLDGNRQFHDDGRNLARIAVDWNEAHEKEVNFDLNLAMDQVQRKDLNEYFNERLTHVEQWIMRHPECMRPKPDFVTNRYEARILLTLNKPDTLVLHATKVAGTIYLCSAVTLQDRQNMNASEKYLRMGSWGFKFEQFMTAGSDPSTGNNEKESYCLVVRAQLSEHSILYGAEVDGVDNRAPDGLPRSTDLIELKTDRLRPSARKQSMPPYKMCNTWAQCALVGIPRVVCGFRDDRGVVKRLRSFRVANLPSDSKGFFSPGAMVDSLSEFLQWVKTQVEVDSPQAVYELTAPDGSFRCRRLPPTEAEAARFLSRDFVKAMLSN
ncbi:decapping and exoribonuclease protein [Hyalella azteca]|uniref:Decapping nuclease n=1 Tax=Hyalella azteca TaxID=294128 RepID=A0A8B7MYT2_HYAAZ|nr:decapping and exoribonuclease protein [Hyalella azteca]